MFRRTLVIILLLSTLSPAFVNLEPPVVGENKGFDGEVSVGAKFNSGNSDTLSVGLGAKGEYAEEKWLLYMLAAYAYGESNNVQDTNEGIFHLRYVHEISDTAYDYEVFVQSEFNEFQDMKARNLAGANIRRDFPNLPFDKFYTGLGLFYSYMEPDSVSDLNPIYKRIKLNTYISFLKQVNENFSITYLGYYQPNIKDVSDFRIFQAVQFTTAITKNTSLSLDFTHKYNATPYQTIENTDIRSIINVKYKFK